MQREIMTGTVLALHQQADATIPEGESLAAQMASLEATALRVKAERDEAIKLLQRTLDIREMGSQGVHKTAIRTFLARAGALPDQYHSVTRIDRMQQLERDLVSMQPEADDAIRLLQAWFRGVEDRYSKGRCDDLRHCVNEVEEALGELEVER